YAHHPVEIRSSINGLREMNDGRIISIFQPHLFSRTKDFYKDFAKELSSADDVILMDIYPAREKPIEGVTSGLIYDEMIKINKNVSYIKDRNSIIASLLSGIKENDVIVFQGAGDITNLCSEFVSKLGSKYN